MTLEEIADLAGVSRSTVSRVVNGDRRVSDAARERVQEVIRDHNYHPQCRRPPPRLPPHPRSSVCSSPTSVGGLFTRSLLPDPDPGRRRRLQRGRPHLTMLMETADDGHRRRPASTSASSAAATSTASSSPASVVDDPIVPRLQADGFPFVLVGRHPGATRSASSTSTTAARAREAVAHLLGHGYRRIAMIAGPPNMIASIDRHAGYVTALQEAGRPAGAVADRLRRFHPARRLPRDAARCSPTPTASPTPSSSPATRWPSAPCGAAEAGLRVPDDIAVMGFDGLDEGARLATAALDRRPAGRRSRARGRAHAAARSDRRPGARRRSNDSCRPELTLRRSCGCACEPTRSTREEVREAETVSRRSRDERLTARTRSRPTGGRSHDHDGRCRGERRAAGIGPQDGAGYGSRPATMPDEGWSDTTMTDRTVRRPRRRHLPRRIDSTGAASCRPPAALGLSATAAGAALTPRPARAAAQESDLQAGHRLPSAAADLDPQLQPAPRPGLRRVWPTQGGIYEPMLIYNTIDRRDRALAGDRLGVQRRQHDASPSPCATASPGRTATPFTSKDVKFTFDYLIEHEALAGTEGIRGGAAIRRERRGAGREDRRLHLQPGLHARSLRHRRADDRAGAHLEGRRRSGHLHQREPGRHRPVHRDRRLRAAVLRDAQEPELLAGRQAVHRRLPRSRSTRTTTPANLATRQRRESTWPPTSSRTSRTPTWPRIRSTSTTGSRRSARPFTSTPTRRTRRSTTRTCARRSAWRSTATRSSQVAMYDYTHPADATGLSDAYDTWRRRGGGRRRRLGHAGRRPRPTSCSTPPVWPRDGDVRALPDGTPMSYDINVVSGWSDWVSAVPDHRPEPGGDRHQGHGPDLRLRRLVRPRAEGRLRPVDLAGAAAARPRSTTTAA